MKKLLILSLFLLVSCASSQNTGDVLTWQGTRAKYQKPARTLPAFPSDSTKFAVGDSTWLKLLSGFGIDFSWAGDSLIIKADTTELATQHDLDSVAARDSVTYADYSGTSSYSSTSGTSNYANTAGGAPPTGAASGVLNQLYPSPGFANNVIEAAHIKSGQVVKSIQGLTDIVRFKGGGGTSISTIDGGSNPDTILVSSIDTAGGGGGIVGISNTDNMLSITDPSGPTPTINMATNKLDTTILGTGSVGSDEIVDGSVNTVDFNETAIAPYANYSTTAGGAPPTGSASGTYISGTYPNGLYLNTNAVDSFKISNGHVTNNKIANDAVTTAKILDGTILRGDVGSTFKAPYSDTADYAKAAPVADNAVTTGKILDGTITSDDVESTFNSPYADTADYALAANPGGPAGGVLEGDFPNPSSLADDVVGTDQIVDNSVTQEKIDSTILRKTNITPGYILEGAISGADTIIQSTSTLAAKLDSAQDYHFISNYEAGDASRLNRNTLSSDIFPASGVVAGTYNWGTVNSKGIVTSANNVAGGGGGTGGGLTYAFKGQFSSTATEDSNYIYGAKSYYLYQIQPAMGSRNEAWNANDDYRYYPDSNYVIVLRNSAGTSGAWFDLWCYEQTLAMPTGVDVTALSETSLRVTWTKPTHSQSYTTATTDSVGLTWRTLQYDSVWSTASNTHKVHIDTETYDITGLSSSQKYFICVVPVTRANESDTALTGNRDTCTTQAGEAEAFFNAKDSLGSLQAWNSVRFLGAKNDGDVIEAAELIDSSGNSRTFAYGTQTNTQKARYLADELNSYGAIGLAYRDSGETRDTCVITCDALASYITAGGSSVPFTVVLVAKTVQGAVGGYNAYQHIWSCDIDGSTSNWGGGRFYATAPTTIGFRRMVGGTDHAYDPSTSPYSVYQYHIWEWIFDGDSISIYCDSVKLGVTTAMNYDTYEVGMFTLGGMRYLLAGVTDYSALRYAEFLFQSKAASAYERSYYIKWLKSIYAID